MTDLKKVAKYSNNLNSYRKSRAGADKVPIFLTNSFILYNYINVVATFTGEKWLILLRCDVMCVGGKLVSKHTCSAWFPQTDGFKALTHSHKHLGYRTFFGVLMSTWSFHSIALQKSNCLVNKKFHRRYKHNNNNTLHFTCLVRWQQRKFWSCLNLRAVISSFIRYSYVYFL